MTIAIMQPYFLPYIGYWQLIRAVDVFVVYDNIKYTKKGWINRNRFLLDGRAACFSLPLRKDSDSRAVVERRLAACFDREALLNRFREAYRKAPRFDAFMPVLERIVRFPADGLFDYILHSIRVVSDYFDLQTPLVASSSVPCDHSLRAAERVMAICGALGAKTYVNPLGGAELYSADAFAARGLGLRFLRSRPFEYFQGWPGFVPSLSIVDVAMFNPPERVREELAAGFSLT